MKKIINTSLKDFIKEDYSVKELDKSTLKSMLTMFKYRLCEYRDEIIRNHDIDISMIYRDLYNEYGDEFISKYYVIEFLIGLKEEMSKYKYTDKEIKDEFNIFLSSLK